jgi:hypothetical protein
MSSRFEKAMELSADAKLASRIGPAGLVALKTTGVSSTTTLKADTFFNKNYSKLQSSLKSIPTFFQKPFTMGKMITYALIFIVILIIGIVIYKRYFTKEGFENTNYAYQKVFNLVNNLKINRTIDVNQDDNKLMNIQPITFKQGAYLSHETFDDNLGILEQLRAGSRFFFLQIDYFEKDLGKEYGKNYEPVLISRNNVGKMICKNSASLKNVFNSIKMYFNNDNVPNYDSPIVIMLHFVRIPYPITDIEKYREYFNKVSNDLETISSLTVNSYSKASKESDLFSKTFTEFNKQIIIGTNIDTVSMNTPLNLDKYIHFRYYETPNDSVDITERQSNLDKANALIYNADYLLSIKDSNEIEKFIKQHKNKFIIVKPKNDQILKKEQIETLLNKLNVNIVLYDYFIDEKNSLDIYKLYNNSSYKLKSVF